MKHSKGIFLLGMIHAGQELISKLREASRRAGWVGPASCRRQAASGCSSSWEEGESGRAACRSHHRSSASQGSAGRKDFSCSCRVA